LLDGDCLANVAARAAINRANSIIVVVSAVNVGAQLPSLLEMVVGRPGVVVLTFWDKVAGSENAEAARIRLEERVGVPVIGCDARHPSEEALRAIRTALDRSGCISKISSTTDWDITSYRNRDIFALPIIGPSLALALLFAPAWIAVSQANAIADVLAQTTRGWHAVLLLRIDAWPSPWSDILGREYGIIAMFPFLMIYALPTVFVFAALHALYTTSGLIDRLAVAVHPLG
jgi:Fe2+ transport system protein B